MKKVLFTATVDSHILQFHLPFLKIFKENGYEVHVATNSDEMIPYCDVKHKVSFERNPFKISNIKAIKQLKEICNREKFDIIHTNTPMGSVVTRIAAIKSRKKYNTRVIYMAHGFHFYNGAPIINWLLYYPVEKAFAKYTDTLLLINKEDYNRAKEKFSKRCKDIRYVPGVGIDKKKFSINFSTNEKDAIRKKIGINKKDYVLTYIARLDKNKNQGFIIDAMKKIIKKRPNIQLLLVGPDEINNKYHVQAKDITNNVHFLGYRKDIPEILSITNISVSSSLREGLPVNILEAMACGKPVVATDARGVRDLVQNNINGFVTRKDDINEFVETIIKLYDDTKLCDKLAKNNLEDIKKYYLDNILLRMNDIYFGKKEKNDKVKDRIDITFGIPMYNSEKYIGSLLECFRKSNVFNYEILIVNDGSTDNSESICLKKKELPIRIISQENSGVSTARNKIIKEANGKYIAFIDSDDLIYFDEYEKALMKMIEEEADLLIAGNRYSISKLIEKEIINSPHKIYRTQLLRDRKIFFNKNISLGEDLLFNLDYYNNCISICFYEREIYNYRQVNTSSLTAKYRNNKFEELMFVYEKCNNMFSEKKVKKALEYIRIKNCFSCLKSELYYKKKHKEEITKYIKKLRSYKKFNFTILNSVKANFIYYIWYLSPRWLLVRIISLSIPEAKK